VASFRGGNAKANTWLDTNLQPELSWPSASRFSRPHLWVHNAEVVSRFFRTLVWAERRPMLA
jgi:hypothetical protein